VSKEPGSRILQDDKDFLVEVIDWHGKEAVKKTPKSTTEPKRIERLKNEAYALGFLSDLTAKHKDLNLYVPKLYNFSDNCVTREYIDASPVVTPDMADYEAARRLDKLAALLADIDRIKPYGEVKFVGHFDYRDIKKNFPKWTKEPMDDGQIKQSEIDKIKQLIIEREEYLQPRFAHGDLSPQAHAFLMENGKIAWVDLENFTPNGARYYDVARTYMRLYSFQKSTQTPRRFLTSFLEKADGIPHLEEQMLAIFLQQSLGIQYDSWYEAKVRTDFRDRAREVLDIALQGGLKGFYS
jgi:hypothetical protein